MTPEMYAEYFVWGFNPLVALAINVALTVVSNLIAGPRKIEGPRADLSRPQTADPGVVIPEIEGAGQMVAQFIWADNRGLNGGPTYEVKDTKTSGNLFTGKTKSTTYRYYSTFAVALCRTEHLPDGKILGFRKIWANDNLIYDAEDVSSTSAQLANANLTADRQIVFGSTGVNVTTQFFNGEETQQPSGIITAVEEDAPAYRGIAYIAFQQLDTTEWGGRVPTIRAEVVAEGATTESTILGYAPLRVDLDDFSTAKYGVSETGAGGWGDQIGVTSESYDTALAAIQASGSARVRANTRELWSSLDKQPPRKGPWARQSWAIYYNPSLDGLPWVFQDEVTNSSQEYYTVAWLRSGSDQKIKVPAGDGPPFPLYHTVDSEPSGDFYIYGAALVTQTIGFTCDYSCPIGDPADTEMIGEPVILPDNPSFCIDRYGNITPNLKEGVSGTYRVLQEGDWEVLQDATVDPSSIDWTSDNFFPSYRKLPFGPVLKSGDANYNDADWWEAEAKKKGITGTFGTDYGVEVTQVCQSTLDLEGIDPDGILLKDIITRDVLRVSPTLTESDLEFVGLDSYTVDGRVITEMESPADRLAEVEEVFKVDCVPVDGKLRFVRRAAAPEVAVDFAEFGAFIPGSQPPKPLDETRPNNVELPRFTNLIYYGIDVHAQDKQTAERTTVTSVGERTINSAFTFDAQQAKDVVEVIHQAQWAELYGRVKFTLSMAHSDIIPSDWITTNDGNRDIKIRVTYQKVLSNGLIEFEGIVDRKENYVPGAFGVAEQLAAGLNALGIPGPTILRVLNLPNLQDEDDTPGFYVAVAPILEDWERADLLISSDNSTFERLDTFDDNLAFGTLASALSASDGLTVEDGHVDIFVQDWKEFSDLTDVAFFNGEQPLYVGGELILWQNAEENADGSWRLSNLIRGWRSTEGLSHAIGDQAIIGQPTFVNRPEGDIGNTLYFKAVTFGSDPDQVFAHEFTNDGESVDEFGVVDIESSRDGSDNLTVTFRAQRRLGTSFNDYSHSSHFTNYEMDVLDSGTVVRTISSTTEEFTYSATDQATDFGSAQSSIDVIIYVVNDYGRGDPTEATV